MLNIKDVNHDWVNIKIDTKLYQIFKQFNASHDISEKLKLFMLFPQDLQNQFMTCRFCTNKIINSNSVVKASMKQQHAKLIVPGVYKRIINDNIYKLSCCEKCLYEHFSDNPPTAPKYMYMKANIYGAYAFNYDRSTYEQICHQTVAITQENLIRKYGEREGIKRWNEYIEKQAFSNSFEYKHRKHGWSKERFEKYNKSRGVTLKNQIAKYGEDEGLKRYNEYCDKQRYTTTLEYFISKYGEIDGTEKYNNYIKIRNGNLCYLENVGSISNIQQKCFSYLTENLNTYNETYFSPKTEEYEIHINGYHYFLDYYDKTQNIVIEFNGDYWHGNPKFYSSYDMLKSCTAGEKWNYDEQRKQNICSYLNNPKFIVIWEYDYKTNKDQVINNILKEYDR